MRKIGAVLPVLLLLGLPAAGEEEGGWAFSATTFEYFAPGAENFLLPVLAADHGALHLEARYNYEAQDAGSVWLGANFSGGEKLEWEITPMIGGVFGDVSGLAPGYEGSLAWRKLELYSEGEYVFDTGDSSESFFYNWSELAYAPADWFRFGLVTQRTRAYETERDIERGLLVGFTYKRLDASAYVFNPDDEDPTVVVALSFDF